MLLLGCCSVKYKKEILYYSLSVRMFESSLDPGDMSLDTPFEGDAQRDLTVAKAGSKIPCLLPERF
jgi:hypothetical protein